MAKKKEVTPVKIRKLRTNYELRFDYTPILATYIKTLPKEHRSVRIDNILDVNGGNKDEWVRIIREIQMGNIISFLVDNSIPFVFENLLPEELNALRVDYVNRQARISAALKLKEADLSFDDADFNHMKIQPYGYQKQAVKFFDINEGNAILGDQPGVGKAMDLDSLISTPFGWIRMGDIKIGDEIHDRFGGTSFVTGIYPQGKKDLYKITFNDNSSAKCCIEHLWKVRDKSRKQRGDDWIVKSLRDLLDIGVTDKVSPSRTKTNRKSSLKWEIPVADSVFYPDVDFIIKPYVLGLNVKSGDKFIPNLYLKGSIEQRKDLLKGLMDANGSCDRNRSNFHTTSHRLALNIVELTQSLGGIAKINTHDRSFENKEIEYRVNIKTLFCPFTLEDKISQWNSSKKNRISKYISKVELLETGVEQQCISVSCSDHTYLTDNYIVTHNTLPPITYASKHGFRTLVICPASLKLNWRKEILNFSNEKAYVYKYTPSKKSGKINYKKEDSLFHIINYESIQSYIKLEYIHKCGGNVIVPGKGTQKCGMQIIDLTKKHTKCPDCKNSNSFKTRVKGLVYIQDKDNSVLDPEDYDMIVIDEFHRIKSVKTDWTQIIKRAFRDTVKRKILISGTAIKSRPMEFFSGLNFMDPEMWNSSHDFGLRYCAGYETNFGWDYGGASNLEELFTRIAPIFLRRLKKDVLSQLPPKTYTEIEIELTPSQMTEYKKLVKDMKIFTNADGTEEEKEEGYLEKIHKLKQFTGRVKLEKMISDGVVEDIVSNGEKLVVMSDYQFLAEELHKEYEDMSVIHTGSMGVEEKQNSVDRFQEDKKINLFSGMVVASGVGITLTEASKLIFLGFAWSPTDMEQAEDRIHRATTTHDNIQIIKYICVDTVDEDINELLKMKAQIVSKVLDNKDFVDNSRRGDESILKSLINRLK